MAMDEELASRYRFLLDHYIDSYKFLYSQYTYSFLPPNQDLLVALLEKTKKIIDEERKSKDITLRPDANLFLLSAFHHVVILPYCAYLPGEHPDPLLDREAMKVRLRQSIILILDGLRGESPHSAHSVLGSIVIQWPSLAKVFGWA
jgi:hypothetical protein